MVKKTIAYIRNPSAGVNYHRLEVPMSLLGSDYTITETDIYKLHDDTYEVLIFNRLPYQPLRTIKILKDRGVRVIMDIDDFWIRPNWHDRRSPYIGLEDDYSQEMQAALKLADCVWTTTQYIQGLLKGIGVESVLVPNAIHLEEEQFKKIPTERTKITCGWVGKSNHMIDFAQLIKPLKSPHPAQMVICGVDPPEEGEKDISPYWQWAGWVFGGGNRNNVKMYKTESIYSYATMYNLLDIVLLPSYPNDTYALCKSNLKILEAGAHKLPVITNGGIYKEINNKLGIRVEHQRDWIRGIKRLCESRRMRQELGEALHEYTKTKYDIFKINEIRKQTIDN